MQIARRTRFALLALCLSSAILGACGRTESKERVTVFAAASLTEAMDALATAFEQQHPTIDVAVHTAGSPRLLLQIREGAAVDVLAPADWVSMRRALSTLALDSESVAPQTLARNQLAAAVERGNPLGIHRVEDFMREGLRVAVAGPEVPAGRYARQALVRNQLFPQPLSDEPSVRAALQRVALGEADLALVYATDLDETHIEGWVLPEPFQPKIELPIAVTSEKDSARSFMDFCLSPDGQAILISLGFSAASE